MFGASNTNYSVFAEQMQYKKIRDQDAISFSIDKN